MSRANMESASPTRQSMQAAAGEPVFGNIRHNKKLCRFNLRGRDKRRKNGLARGMKGGRIHGMNGAPELPIDRVGVAVRHGVIGQPRSPLKCYPHNARGVSPFSQR